MAFRHLIAMKCPGRFRLMLHLRTRYTVVEVEVKAYGVDWLDAEVLAWCLWSFHRQHLVLLCDLRASVRWLGANAGSVGGETGDSAKRADTRGRSDEDSRNESGSTLIMVV